jgi:xylulokinase
VTPDLVLGLDCGTQSAKAGIWTLGGVAASRGSCPLAVSSPLPGWAEQDPRQWWTSSCTAIRAACAEVDASRIVALGVAWQRESFTLADAAGEPLRPGILWLDVRAHQEAALRAAEGDGLHAQTGKPMDVTLTLPRMDWLRAHEPELFRDPARWVDTGAWLLGKLTGRRATCVAGADTAGMIALASRSWSEEVLSRAGLRVTDLPELVEPGSLVGRLTGEASRDTGLPAGIPVVAAGGDGQVFAAAMQGADASPTLTLGTSVVLGMPAQEASISPLYRTLFAASADRSYLREAVIQSGTYLFRWLQELLAAGDEQALESWEREAQTLPPGSEGLVTVPHWWGTRFPKALPDARGVTIGWSPRHGGTHLYRSLLEGVAFELRLFLGLIAAPSSRGLVGRLAVGGGGAKSMLWRSIIADVLGCELWFSEEPEPVAQGAALLACAGAGLVASFAEAAACFVRPGKPVCPEPGRHARYGQLYDKVYVPLREACAGLSSTLTRLARD